MSISVGDDSSNRSLIANRHSQWKNQKIFIDRIYQVSITNHHLFHISLSHQPYMSLHHYVAIDGICYTVFPQGIRSSETFITSKWNQESVRCILLSLSLIIDCTDKCWLVTVNIDYDAFRFQTDFSNFSDCFNVALLLLHAFADFQQLSSWHRIGPSSCWTHPRNTDMFIFWIVGMSSTDSRRYGTKYAYHFTSKHVPLGYSGYSFF